MERVNYTIKLEDAKFLFRTNFSGHIDQYNRAIGVNPRGEKVGKRTFNVVLPLDQADKYKFDGWNVKYWSKYVEEGGDPVAFLEVTVSFANIPPHIYYIDEHDKILSQVTEETIDELDNADIDYVDMVIQPYNWKNDNGEIGGVKAYLKSMYVRLADDGFSGKYRNLD